MVRIEFDGNKSWIFATILIEMLWFVVLIILHQEKLKIAENNFWKLSKRWIGNINDSVCEPEV